MSISRTLAPGRLVIASHNEGKVREITALLGPYGMAPVSAGSLGLPEPEETGTTFAENAKLKADNAALSAAVSDVAALKQAVAALQVKGEEGAVRTVSLTK